MGTNGPDNNLREYSEHLQIIANISEKQLHYYSADITSPDQIHKVFEQIITHLRNPLRGFVACAGISGDSPAMDYPIEKFRRIIDINLTGTFICAQAAAKEFKRGNKQGSIVLIASMSGHGSNKGVDTAAYNSSKAAVHQLARSLAAEWGSRPDCPLIRVNSISPGYIRTVLTVDTLKKPGIEKLWEEGNMLNRLSEVDEYRAPVLFLLGDGSSFVTGSDLRVDGGHTAW
jgi:NAD(P)-dependent dehydrogenase (short-subunit alcohol dehydrogenase family)